MVVHSVDHLKEQAADRQVIFFAPLGKRQSEVLKTFRV